MERNNNSRRVKRFKKVAVARTNKILHMLNLLENCSNKNNYTYDEEWVEKMFNKIDNSVKEVKVSFRKPLQTKFSLYEK